MIVEKYTLAMENDRSSHPARCEVFGFSFGFSFAADRLQRAAGLEIHRRWVESIGLLMEFMKSNFLDRIEKYPAARLFWDTERQLWLCRKNGHWGSLKKKTTDF